MFQHPYTSLCSSHTATTYGLHSVWTMAKIFLSSTHSFLSEKKGLGNLLPLKEELANVTWISIPDTSQIPGLASTCDPTTNFLTNHSLSKYRKCVTPTIHSFPLVTQRPTSLVSWAQLHGGADWIQMAGQQQTMDANESSLCFCCYNTGQSVPGSEWQLILAIRRFPWHLACACSHRQQSCCQTPAS